MWGIVPAAGMGSRIQPLAFSKELLPVGSRIENGVERPRAVSEYLVERMLLAGATKICFVISPWKADILRYYGGAIGGASLCYAAQLRAAGLCDALFQAAPFIAPHEQVLVGLPDTIWFPETGFSDLSNDALSFLLFPVNRPHLFDAVLLDEQQNVSEIRVKSADPGTHWVWGAFKLTGAILRDLRALWEERQREDEYLGTLVNAYIARGGRALGVKAGEDYVDVGTLDGYRAAMQVLEKRRSSHGLPLEVAAQVAPLQQVR